MWQAPDPLPATWPADLTFTLALGEEQVTVGLAGGSYPTSQWQAGELVRAKVQLTYTGSTAPPVLTVGPTRLELTALPR